MIVNESNWSICWCIGFVEDIHILVLFISFEVSLIFEDKATDYSHEKPKGDENGTGKDTLSLFSIPSIVDFLVMSVNTDIIVCPTDPQGFQLCAVAFGHSDENEVLPPHRLVSRGRASHIRSNQTPFTHLDLLIHHCHIAVFKEKQEEQVWVLDVSNDIFFLSYWQLAFSKIYWKFGQMLGIFDFLVFYHFWRKFRPMLLRKRKVKQFIIAWGQKRVSVYMQATTFSWSLVQQWYWCHYCWSCKHHFYYSYIEIRNE